MFQLNHIFGSLADWFYLQSARRRPTVLTLAAAGPVSPPALLDRVDRFVVEYPEGRDELIKIGINQERIRIILPPVDLKRFHPANGPRDPFTVLFASSPERAEWLDARGVPLLLDAAALRPQMRFRLLWRPWGDSEHLVRSWLADRQLRNVELVVGRQLDMPLQYHAAHITVAPFVEPSRCKPAPNSIIESLACGRPVVTTNLVGLSSLIQESGAGLVCPPDPVAFVGQLDRLAAEWDAYSLRARRFAERCFCANAFVAAYRNLYDDVLACRAA